MSNTGEFELIEFIRAQQTVRRSDVLLGIGDDAAVLAVPEDQSLVMCSDTLNERVHFPRNTSPEAIGWKSLAVNLSDLAAMGAQPTWCLLNLCLPDSNLRWLERFVSGFMELASEANIALIGGDTTRGPLSISVTACGFVPAGRELRRSGAKAGDDIWVSGELGEAAWVLRRLLEGEAVKDAARMALDQPEPRIALGQALRGIATSCIDLSDGLLQDLNHICTASGVGAEIDAEKLPSSTAFLDCVGPEEQLALQSSGDDYELCFTASPSQRENISQIAQDVGISLSIIGACNTNSGIRVFRDGEEVDIPLRGYSHF